ncbi:MAG: hypothetical protein H0T52_12530 [Lautropia sp.]|nr:hypothetical protein [Lautropia sp.]
MKGDELESDKLGLMAFWSDIDPAYAARFRQWHNCEHIPERVAIRGFRTGQRYRCVGPGRKFLMFYETDSPEVLQSEAYLAALNSPTPWTLESLQHFKNPLRNLYRKLSDRGARSESATPYLICVRFDLAPGTADAGTGAALSDIGAALGTASTRRTRLFQLNEAATKIATRERTIYGEQPDSQQFLVFLDEPEMVDERALAALQSRAGSTAASQLDVQRYWLEFFLNSPWSAPSARSAQGPG